MIWLWEKTVSLPTPAFNDLHASNCKDDTISCFIFTAAHTFPSSILSSRKAVGTKQRNFFKGTRAPPLARGGAMWVPGAVVWCTPSLLTPMFELGYPPAHCPKLRDNISFRLKVPWNNVLLPDCCWLFQKIPHIWSSGYEKRCLSWERKLAIL